MYAEGTGLGWIRESLATKNIGGSMAEGTGVTIGGIGGLLAAAFSYAKWHGFLLAVGHFMLGWIYVVYYLIAYGSPFK